MTPEIKTYNIDYDTFGKAILNRETFRVPKKSRYCVMASDGSFDRMYVVAAKVLVASDGAILFLNENDDIIVGVSSSKYSSFFRVDENDVPIDVSGHIL